MTAWNTTRQFHCGEAHNTNTFSFRDVNELGLMACAMLTDIETQRNVIFLSTKI